MEDITITSENIYTMSLNDLTNHLAEIIKTPSLWDTLGKDDFLTNIEIPEIMIHIKGERYNSSIGTGLMKQITNLQDKVYRLYALAVYQDINFKISDDEKKALEIFVQVEQGSSKVIIKFIKEFFKQIDKMHNWMKFTAILAIIGASTAVLIFNKKADVQLEQFKAVQETSTIEGFIDLQKETNKMQMELVSLSSSLMTELASINGEIEINGEAISQRELRTAAAEKKKVLKDMTTVTKEPYSKHIQGEFILEGLTMSKDANHNRPKTINFLDINSGKRLVYKPDYEEISKSEQEFLTSCVKGDQIKLDMVVFYDGNDNITDVHLLKWNDQDIDSPLLF